MRCRCAWSWLRERDTADQGSRRGALLTDTGPSDGPARPLPAGPAPAYATYLGGLRARRVVVPKCRRCGDLVWPPRPVCPHCRGTEFTGHELPGRGVVYTYTIVRRAFHPWFAERVPYGVVVGDLGQGVRILGSLFGPDAERLACGVAVVARFDVSGPVPVLEWELGR